MLIVTHPCNNGARASATQTVRLRISIPYSFHNYVAFRHTLKAFDQLAPAHLAIVAQHVDRRDATAFYHHVALRRIFDAAHLTDTRFEFAAQAQGRVAESLEETQKTALD